MSLLNKIAISNGNKARKAAANRTIAVMNSQKVAAWNRSLQVATYQKKWMRSNLLVEGGTPHHLISGS
jgi:MOSC domain-containing protein YiiM